MEISQATMLYVAKLIVICDSQCVYALSSTVPSPIVQVNFASRAIATYAGNSVTLNCTIMLTEGITDSGFTVNSTWTKNGVMFPGVSGRITVNDTTRVSGTTFFNNLVFSSLSTRDNGTYTCVVTLSSSYEFVADAMVSDSTSLAVEGMAIKLKFIGLVVVPEFRIAAHNVNPDCDFIFYSYACSILLFLDSANHNLGSLPQHHSSPQCGSLQYHLPHMHCHQQC